MFQVSLILNSVLKMVLVQDILVLFNLINLMSVLELFVLVVHKTFVFSAEFETSEMFV